MRNFRFALAGLLCLVMQLITGCQRAPNLKQSLLSARPPASTSGPMVIAVYQPWFGDKAHINIGYNSHDRKVLREQVVKAKDLGIDAFAVNYYGPRHEFMDKGFALMQQVAFENGFKVAMLYDEAVDAPGAATEAVMVDLQSAYDHYFAPHAQSPGQAYLRYDGRPVIFIFPKKNTGTDWNRVRNMVNTWAESPLLFYAGDNPKYANDFDGFFPWVQPGRAGWAPDGSNWGEEYLEDFYRNFDSRHPGKLMAGAVWPGFDDSKARWGQHRFMDARCGKTFADTLRIFHQFGDGRAPFLVIETWNDHEEGSGIEFGLPKC